MKELSLLEMLMIAVVGGTVMGLVHLSVEQIIRNRRGRQ